MLCLGKNKKTKTKQNKNKKTKNKNKTNKKQKQNKQTNIANVPTLKLIQTRTEDNDGCKFKIPCCLPDSIRQSQ